jgi:hypothetical protein
MTRRVAGVVSSDTALFFFFFFEKAPVELLYPISRLIPTVVRYHQILGDCQSLPATTLHGEPADSVALQLRAC